LDLSVNVNPWGPHPAVGQAVQQAALGHYPDPHATAAREALARTLGVESARIVVGHGSTELLWAAVSLMQGSSRPWLVVGPTFSEPLIAARALGVAHVEYRSHAHDDFALDLAALSRALEACDAAGVYLCQPNNPTGGALPATALRELCEQHPSRLFVLDQAFLALSTRHADAAVTFPDNVLCVRSLTKEHALPGLRVGYAIGAPALLARLNARRPSWMVSSLAQAAVVAACAQTAYVADVRERLLRGASALAQGCRALGLAVVPSDSHYFIVRVAQADALRQRLLRRHGVVVRSCSSFGLPNYVRMAGCAETECTRALTALAAECEP
jgi:histidinol-phosphate/aromatic aminotransferase/cobyric acid decarboxylase-like protein